jgi:acyl carrier protein
MDEQAIRDTLFAALRTIAPEVTPDEIAADRPLRDQVDLDSMDFLNFLIRLHERLGVDVPESDYAKLVTLADFVAYLQARVGGRK